MPSISFVARIRVGAHKPTNIPKFSSPVMKYRYNEKPTDNILAANPTFEIFPFILNHLLHNAPRFPFKNIMFIKIRNYNLLSIIFLLVEYYR